MSQRIKECFIWDLIRCNEKYIFKASDQCAYCREETENTAVAKSPTMIFPVIIIATMTVS